MLVYYSHLMYKLAYKEARIISFWSGVRWMGRNCTWESEPGHVSLLGLHLNISFQGRAHKCIPSKIFLETMLLYQYTKTESGNCKIWSKNRHECSPVYSSLGVAARGRGLKRRRIFILDYKHCCSFQPKICLQWQLIYRPIIIISNISYCLIGNDICFPGWGFLSFPHLWDEANILPR